jgi:DNA-3-methyladenine glycosylase II
MFLIFHLMRADVLPLDDIGMLRGISENYFSGESVSRSEAKEVAANWAPYRSVAVWYLWRSLDPLPVASSSPSSMTAQPPASKSAICAK